jgi:hypothetical protein
MEDKNGDNNEQSSLLDYYTGFRWGAGWGGDEGTCKSPAPTHTHISPPVRVASVTIYAKTTLYRSPSFSMIYKLLLVDEREAKGEKPLPGQQI